MGPLSNAWKALQDVKTTHQTKLLFGQVTLTMSLDKTVLLIGQAFKATTYHRRFNALATMMKDHNTLKETVKQKQELLKDEHEKLLGGKFQTYITGFDLSFGSVVVKIYRFATLCWVNNDENMQPNKYSLSITGQ